MQHDCSIDDLDRTEELPVLDVAAYEASLAEGENGRPRTGSVTVEVSSEIDESAEMAQEHADISAHAAAHARHGSQPLMVNVERILKRIAELEADARAAYEANTALAKRTDALLMDRDQQALSIESLEAENARLCEQRSLADELSRQLAAKLAECDRLTSVVHLRDGAIDELTRARDELAAQLAAAEQSLRESRTMLLGREEVIAEKDVQLAQLSKDLEHAAGELAAERQRREALDQRLSALDETHSRSLDELAERAAQINALRTDLEQAQCARDEIAAGLTAQLETVREEHAAMASQMEMVRARMKSLRRQLFSKDAQIAGLQAELAVHTEALAAIDRDVNRIGQDADAESFDEIEGLLEPIEHPGAPIVLTGKTLTVGRTSENDVCIPSNLISRHHARILMGPTGVIIEDVGSTNGCFVNGEQIRQRLMHDGDVLGLGALQYRLRTRSPDDARARAGVVPTLTAVARATDRCFAFVPRLVEKNMNTGADVPTEVNEHQAARVT